MTEMSDEVRKDVEKAAKMFALAGKNTNEHEAALAISKAQAILEKHNLDMSVLEEAGEDGRRTKEKFFGGFYEYEQQVWRYVADLNFCVYWCQSTWVERTVFDAKALAIRDPYRRTHVLKKQHRLVGRKVNVEMTKAMAGYLLQTIERLCREWLLETNSDAPMNRLLRTRTAVSFREGMAETIVDKLWERSRERERDEKEKARRARERAEAAGASMETTLTVADVKKSERDANLDFIYGEGYTARQAKAQAERAEAARIEQERYTQWAAANPEAAAKKEAEEREKQRKRDARRAFSSGPTKQRDWRAYSAGERRGKTVGLDPQAAGASVAGVLR